MAAPLLPILVRLLGTQGGKAAASGATSTVSSSSFSNAAKNFMASRGGQLVADKAIDSVLYSRVANRYQGGGQGRSTPDEMKNTAMEFGNNARRMMGLTLNPLDKVKAPIDMAKQIADFPRLLRKWGEELKSSQEHLRAYNSTIANAYIASEARQIKRNIESGTRTGGSTKALIQSMDGLKDSTQLYQDLSTNVMNSIVKLGTDGLTEIVKIVEYVTYIEEVAQVLNEMLGEAGGEQSAFQFFGQFAPNEEAKREMLNPPVAGKAPFAGRVAGAGAGAAARMMPRKKR